MGAFRLSAEKCPFDFIDVCRNIAAAVPNVSIVIVGVGPMQADVEEHIKQSGLENIVRLVGRRQDVSVFLSMADLVLHTARLEGMPNILMEAQSLGIPVVATAVGGVPDVVIHGHTGFLTNVNDINQLSANCISLLTNPELLRAFSVNASKHLEQFKSIETMASRYLEIID
jgi:glycosyltransferase involved in cell wall biosynthesis